MRRESDFKSLAWCLFGLAAVILSIGVSVGAGKADNVSLEAANIKLAATKSLNQAREITQSTEELVKQLQYREQAYNELKQKYDTLARQNREIKALEPEIEKIESLKPYELENIEVQLEAKDKELTKEISDLTEE